MPGTWETKKAKARLRKANRAYASWVQPPDAENRMSGGVGEVMGAIPSPRPDRGLGF